MQYIFFFFIFLSFIFGGFINAETDDIIINEIAWMGDERSANNEWIELKNLSNHNLDLSGWKLVSEDGSPNIDLEGIVEAGGLFLLERTNDNSVQNKKADLIYSGALSNGGEKLFLIDSTGAEKNVLDCSANWPAGDNDDKRTMQFMGEEWVNSCKAGGSPGEENVFCEDYLDVIDNEDEKDIESPYAEVPNGATLELEDKDIDDDIENEIMAYDVLINEIVSDPLKGKDEWIELYNIKNFQVSLENWLLVDGSGAETILSGFIAAGSYYIIKNPKGRLNNSGDELILKNDKGLIIDNLLYGDWAGSGSDNAPAPGKGFSLARLEGRNKGKNIEDFSLTDIITPGSRNIINFKENFEEEKTIKEKKEKFEAIVIISEIFPNPEGLDSEEWIELYNKGNLEADLSFWRLLNNTVSYEFENVRLAAGEYFLLQRNESGIALNNYSDKLQLFRAGEKKAVYSLQYKNAPEGVSYAVSEDNPNEIYYWTIEPSPGEKNKIKIANRKPIADIYIPVEKEGIKEGDFFVCDAGDSIDPDGDKLSYYWNFSDDVIKKGILVSHVFDNSGKYEIELEVSDGEYLARTSKKIEVLSRETEKIDYKKGDIKIIINELMPNPEGRDEEGEWIEFKNLNSEKVNLKKWRIGDASSKTPFKIEDDFFVNAGDFFILERPQTGIVLNNDYDRVEIYDFQDNLIDKIEYNKAPVGKSYVRDGNGEWFWSDIASKGAENIIIGVKNENLQIKTNVVSKTEIPKQQSDFFEGTVIVEPGSLYEQYFYISGDNEAYQIYNYKKDFGAYTLGDILRVRGERGLINDEIRIKTKSSSDIEIIGRNEELVVKKIDSSSFSNDLLAFLVEIEGELGRKSGSDFFLFDDHGEFRIFLRKKETFDTSELKIADNLKIVGILSKTKTGFRILPRFSSDIQKINTKEDLKVLGKFAGSEELKLEKRQDNDFFKYFVVISGSFIILIYALKRKKT